jgi:hypothetical protein
MRVPWHHDAPLQGLQACSLHQLPAAPVLNLEYLEQHLNKVFHSIMAWVFQTNLTQLWLWRRASVTLACHYEYLPVEIQPGPDHAGRRQLQPFPCCHTHAGFVCKCAARIAVSCCLIGLHQSSVFDCVVARGSVQLLQIHALSKDCAWLNCLNVTHGGCWHARTLSRCASMQSRPETQRHTEHNTDQNQNQECT